MKIRKQICFGLTIALMCSILQQPVQAGEIRLERSADVTPDNAAKMTEEEIFEDETPDKTGESTEKEIAEDGGIEEKITGNEVLDLRELPKTEHMNGMQEGQFSVKGRMIGNLEGGRLPDEVMYYRELNQESRQSANICQKGIYFLNGRELTFFSIETGEAEVVYTAPESIEDSYEIDGRLYILQKAYNREERKMEWQVAVYNMDEKKLETKISVPEQARSVGVDNSGRIYLAGREEGQWYLYLLSAQGAMLSQVKAPGTVYDFGGFDSTTGNFYFEYYYNWVYWGYDHDMTSLGVGSVKNNVLQIYTGPPAILISQIYFYNRQRSMDMVGNKYLCIDNTVRTCVEILSAADIDSAEPKESDALLFYLGREDEEDENAEFDRLACVGSRTVYNEGRNSIITFQDRQTLAEYIPETETLLGTYATAHPVFSLMNYGDNIIAVEKEGTNFYLEEFDCKSLATLFIQGDSHSMAPGTSMQLTVSDGNTSEGSIKNIFQWSTSNSKIVSVNQSGKVFAWRKGKAVITVKSPTGLSASFDLTVSGSSSVKSPKKNALNLKGKSSQNRSGNDYSKFGRITGSYLVENSDGTCVRVELERNSGKIIAETFDINTGKRKSRKIWKNELDLFGGFFQGSEHNYIVYGGMNSEENNKKEVLRVVKYSKNWKRLGSVSLRGANTTWPFRAGSLRMAETGGKLYIHTCHEMYAEDGVNHQANMTCVVNEKDMAMEQSYYDVLNIAQSGYVSHSFNQFIQADETHVYRVDHGDAWPRAVSITRCEVGGAITDVKYTLPFDIGGENGDNNTGVSVGGFELSSDSCLIAGNSVPQGEKFQGTEGQRNIFITVTDKELEDSRTVWITKHKGGKNIVNTPHLVKIGEDQFLLMWEEKKGKTGEMVTKMVTLDGNANLTSSIVSCGMPLSECKPVSFANGLVRWYVTDKSSPVLYSINPYDLESIHEAKVESLSIKGISKKIAAGKKIKLSVQVKPKDASIQSVEWSSSNKKIATVNQSGIVTMKKNSGGKSVKITAVAQDGSGKRATYKIVSMKGIVKKVTISGKKSVKAGKSIKLKATVTASKGANRKLKWESSNTKYAKVSSSGKVQAYQAGKGKKVKITARATDGSGKKKTVAIQIK